MKLIIQILIILILTTLVICQPIEPTSLREKRGIKKFSKKFGKFAGSFGKAALSKVGSNALKKAGQWILPTFALG
ncbi:hypothetical protein B9Z55_012390 [Caenorhabditis nigoni]|uniref:Uncharacterized protein n=1 Tax=Caenorhabditis nigoni TaxID=1611254 RepID=A0A2G5TX06_9PELO|nr:hypothetical protein B9Z55_012390 [Caenorhabditis nigoni]